MNKEQFFNPYYAAQQGNAQMGQINIHQRIIIEKQLDILIKMVEYNNQMLRYIQQNNINTNANGDGGAIIVRM